ncbi:peptidase M16 [candidate division KSB3 bacterium]|uniref:Peptidase M16 n=1 Tax=candidate division KSB3 bacterium TaxID=2044937 RepID=A0A2G6KHE6_9BACT|nr:MAG: peptidase M16 [candidate division KSB3 bacterium]
MKICTQLVFAGVLVVLLLPSLAVAQSLEGKVIEHTLENGLTLLLYERHQAPIIACRIYVAAGSANDKLGETGIAHMTEHIAFKGTSTIGTTDYNKEKIVLAKLDEVWEKISRESEKGESADQEKLAQFQEQFALLGEEAEQYVISEAYSKIIEENGGVGLNASTSRDETQYFVSLPANRLELWMMLEADRLMNTVPREFYKERDVIMEERRMRTDASPIGTLVEQFIGTAFIAHPYGFPGIGWASDIQNITVAQLMKFYETYYTPANMTVAIVGDIQPDEVIRLAEKYFGQLPTGEPAPKIRTIEPAQVGERRIQVEWDSSPYVLLGYHRPSVTHEDDIVFDVISFLLSSGRTSQLYKNLVEEQQLAVHVDTIASFPGQKYPTLFMVVGIPLAPHTLEELEAALDAEIEKLKTEPIDEKQLQKVINNVEAAFIDSLSSNSGLAAQLTFAHRVFGDWRAIEKQVERIKTIRAEDVQRVANTYLTKQNQTVAWLVKK